MLIDMKGMNKIFLKVGINTLVQSAGKVISAGLGIFTVLLLTRYLGSSGYGTFTLAFTFVSFFSVIADFGLQTAMVREFSQAEHGKEQYGSFLLLKIVLIIIASLLAFISLLFFPYAQSVTFSIYIAILAVAVSGLTTYGTIIFQSRIRLDLVTLVDVITKISTVGFIILFVFLKYNLYAIIATVLIGNLVGLGLTTYLVRDTIYFTYNGDKIKNILIMSMPIGITSFLGLAYFKVDTIMLSVMKNSTEVGLYSLPYKVLENILMVWGFYMASVYPLLAKFIGEGGIQQIRKLLKNSVYVALLLSLPMILGGVLFAPFIISIFGGKLFHASIPALQILVFAIPFLFVNNLFSDFFFAKRENKVVFIGIVLSLVANILLNFYFIPIYGFIGASYITVISALLFTLYSIMLIAFSKEKYL